MTSRTKRAMGVLVPIICASLFAGCDTSGILNTSRFGALDTGTYYKSAKDFESATIGAYSTFQNLTALGREDRTMFRLGLSRDDDTRPPGNNRYHDFSLSPGDGAVSGIWDYSYRAALRTNLILQQLELTDQLTDAERARFAGEAKFVRASFYFLLARYYGNVPLVTEIATSIEETRPGMSQPGQVWDLIESDLTDAIAGLQGLNLEAGRASEWAARALLGKVQIYRAQHLNEPAKYGQAITNLEAVVASGRFSLVPYENNFKYTTENNAESLFEMQASFGTDINGWAPVDENGGGASSGSGRHLATGAGGRNGINAPGGFDWGDGGIVITQNLVNAFEKYDSAVVAVPGATAGATAKVVVRDPRAYFTFYSTGEKYGRACPDNAGGTPVPFNFVWGCSGGGVNASAVAETFWSITGFMPAKYIRPYENYSGGQNLNQSVSQNNERLIRYADVLLLLAEAKILSSSPDLAGAAALINQVRARARDAWDSAYGSGSADAALYASFQRPANLLADRPAGVSAAQMHEWLRAERRAEFALEIHRWDDIVRWLRAGILQRSDIVFGNDAANTNFNPATHLLVPIPGSEIDLNRNLTQNPGY